MALTTEEEAIRDNILAAPDVVRTVVTSEAITEPLGAAGGMTRETLVEWSSATVEVGKKYRQTPAYLNGPDSKAWGARSDTVEAVV